MGLTPTLRLFCAATPSELTHESSGHDDWPLLDTSCRLLRDFVSGPRLDVPAGLYPPSLASRSRARRHGHRWLSALPQELASMRREVRTTAFGPRARARKQGGARFFGPGSARRRGSAPAATTHQACREQIGIEIEGKPRKPAGLASAGRAVAARWEQSRTNEPRSLAAHRLRLNRHEVVLAVLALTQGEEHLHQKTIGRALVHDDDGFR